MSSPSGGMAFDLVIVGGGLAGLALAVALRDSGRRLALIEGRPPERAPGWDNRVYALSPASVAFLDRTGAWGRLDPSRIAAVEAMAVQGDDGGRLAFSAYQANAEALAWIVEASALAMELWESARRQGNLTLLSPATPAALAVGESSARLDLADGRPLEAALIVGADGRDSWTRNAAGLGATATPYGEHGVVANFACSEEHAGTAFQWFRDDGILAWLPLPGRRFSMVWSTADEHARHLVGLNPDDLAARVAEAGAHRLGSLQAISPAAAFPLAMLTVPECIGPRLALIGDAAHGIHPLSGHGINLGFTDAASLAGIIGACANWQDIGRRQVLRRYQRDRREEVRMLQQSTHALHELFATTLPGLRPLRNLGLSVVDRLPFVKSALVRYAMG